MESSDRLRLDPGLIRRRGAPGAGERSTSLVQLWSRFSLDQLDPVAERVVDVAPPDAGHLVVEAHRVARRLERRAQRVEVLDHAAPGGPCGPAGSPSSTPRCSVTVGLREPAPAPGGEHGGLRAPPRGPGHLVEPPGGILPAGRHRQLDVVDSRQAGTPRTTSDERRCDTSEAMRLLGGWPSERPLTCAQTWDR